MRNVIRPRLILLFTLSVILFSLTCPLVSHSSTLYERSLKKLEANLKTASSDDFVFAVLGDSRDNDEMFRKVLSEVAKVQPLFILHGGDIVNTGTEKRFNRFFDIVDSTIPDIPLFVFMGNHELTYNMKSEGGKKLFREKIGPLNYTLDMKKIAIRIVGLDNSLDELTKYQLDYLEKQLTSARKYKFVIMHMPPETQKWKHGHCFSKGADKLIHIMAEKKVSVAFFSHLHLYAQDEIKGVKYIITGGSAAPLHTKVPFGEPTNHFVVVRVKNGKVTTEVVRVLSDVTRTNLQKDTITRKFYVW
ncbi:MAG: metallophosphoesterase [Syntrophaceae bacterium]